MIASASVPGFVAASRTVRVASLHPSALASLVASAALRVASGVRTASARPAVASAQPRHRLASVTAVASRAAVASAAASRLGLASATRAASAAFRSHLASATGPRSHLASATAPRAHLASATAPRAHLASATAPRAHLASGVHSASRVASRVASAVGSYAPQLSLYPRTPLTAVNVDHLASAVLHVLASAKARHAESPAAPTQQLASAIARRLTSPTFHVASGALTGVASRLASALARRFSASAPLQTGEADAGAALAKGKGAAG